MVQHPHKFKTEKYTRNTRSHTPSSEQENRLRRLYKMTPEACDATSSVDQLAVCPSEVYPEPSHTNILISLESHDILGRRVW